MTPREQSKPSVPTSQRGPSSSANQKRPHRKSRKGCFNCKRRKVKCDEDKPACANCIRFKIPCHYPYSLSPTGGSWVSSPSDPVMTMTPSTSSESSEGASPPPSSARRGRGRPRKDWSSIPPSNPAPKPPSLPIISPSGTSCTRALNVADAELLFHFVLYTAPTFVKGGHEPPDDSIVRFWVHNAPRIGLSHHYVLHFIHAIAGYHLAYQSRKDHNTEPGASSGAGADQQQSYASLAESHLSAGLARMTKALPNLNNDNCGALYVAATLVCYCTFAAGPSSPGDLLLCDTSDSSGPTKWLPLIRGLKYIREAADITALSTGLTAPLFTGGPGDDTAGPRCTRDGFPRADWVAPLGQLRNLVSRGAGDGSEGGGEGNREVYRRSFEILENIYAATYGDDDGVYDGAPEYQFVLMWLYRVEDEFVAGLQEKGKEPLALILLAYFAPLLLTMKGNWFLDGWAEHLLARIGEYVPADMEHWLRWPREQVGFAVRREEKSSEDQLCIR